MYDRSGDGTGSSEVKIRTNTSKFTNMIIARFRESRYLVRESEVFIKDKTKVASRVSSSCCSIPKRGRLKGDRGQKSMPNFTTVYPCKIREEVGEMHE